MIALLLALTQPAAAQPAAAPPAPAPAATPDRCWTVERHGATPVHVYRGDRVCVDLAPAREMQGVWINEFESSSFHEGARTTAEAIARPRRAWLTIDGQTRTPPGFTRLRGHAYRITMIARPARDMNRKPAEGYGHMGVSPGLVVAERIVAMEDLGPARPR